MQGSGLARVGRAALDLLYPPRCVVCGSGGRFLCAACIEVLPRADGRRCSQCWLPLRGTQCLVCAEHPSSLTRLRSVFRYEGDVRRMVHAFKFGGQSSLAPDLASLLAASFFEHRLVAGAIVPVPLTGARHRTRGYNQALLLANELSKNIGVPVVKALVRSGQARPQAGSATAEERRRNVEGAFHPAKVASVAGARILLLDDVATTGATLDACASVLRDEMGALSVAGLTLARED